MPPSLLRCSDAQIQSRSLNLCLPNWEIGRVVTVSEIFCERVFGSKSWFRSFSVSDETLKDLPIFFGAVEKRFFQGGQREQLKRNEFELKNLNKTKI